MKNYRYECYRVTENGVVQEAPITDDEFETLEELTRSLAREIKVDIENGPNCYEYRVYERSDWKQISLTVPVEIVL